MGYQNSDYYKHIACLSEEGRAMEEELEQLAKDWGYKALPGLISMEQREHYMDKLPDFWKDEEFVGKELELLSPDGRVIATGVTERGYVCGDYGIFLEIPTENIVFDNIKVQKGEEYRINDPKYSDKVKYHWYTDKGGNGIKLYHQQKGVAYADYQPGMWYVSPYEVSVREVNRELTKNTPPKNKKTAMERD